MAISLLYDKSRGQSEVIGVVLLTAVIVILMTLVGVTILGTVETQEEPAANLELTVTGTTDTITNVSIAHHGGTHLAADDVTATLRANATASVPLADFREQQGDGDDTFEPGERLGYNYTASGPLRVVVVHDPTNTVLVDQKCDVPTTTGSVRC